MNRANPPYPLFCIPREFVKVVLGNTFVKMTRGLSPLAVSLGVQPILMSDYSHEARRGNCSDYSQKAHRQPFVISILQSESSCYTP